MSNAIASHASTPTGERCRVCARALGRPVFSSELLGESVSYFECSACAYVQTQRPTWLERAYASPINDSDTGILARNTHNAGVVLATLATLRCLTGTVVDFAGGYGILVRMLRDLGVNALWSDPYCRNLVATGFEHAGQPAELVTAFEVFEHMVDPPVELRKVFSLGPNLLFSTLMMPTPTPPPESWWYYGLNHGQHVGFLRRETLSFLADSLGKHALTDGHSYHMLTERPASLAGWRNRVRVAARAPRFFARGLTSKTWSDHLQLIKPS